MFIKTPDLYLTLVDGFTKMGDVFHHNDVACWSSIVVSLLSTFTVVGDGDFSFLTALL